MKSFSSAIVLDVQMSNETTKDSALEKYETNMKTNSDEAAMAKNIKWTTRNGKIVL